MKNSVFKKRLKENLEKVKSGTLGDYENLPPGRYEGKVTGGAMDAEAEKPWLFIKFEVTSGELEGKSQSRFYSFSNDFGMAQMVQELSMLGYDLDAVEEPKQLQEILDDLADNNVYVIFSVKANRKNPDYPKVRLVSAEGAPEEEEAEEPEPEKEKPAAKPKTNIKPKKEPEPEPEPEEEAEEESDADVPEEPEGSADDDAEYDVEKGDKVKVLINGKSVVGIAMEFDEEKSTMDVKVGKKKYTVDYDHFLNKV